MSLTTAIWETCRVDTGLFHFKTAMTARPSQSFRSGRIFTHHFCRQSFARRHALSSASTHTALPFTSTSDQESIQWHTTGWFIPSRSPPS